MTKYQLIVCSIAAILTNTTCGTATLATTSTGDVTPAEVRAFVESNIDSIYSLDQAPDDRTTAGVRRAATDILLDRYLARRAEDAGLLSDPLVVARLAASYREVLGNAAQSLVNRETTVTLAEAEKAYRDNPTSFTREEQLEIVLCQARISPEDAGTAALIAAEKARNALETHADSVRLPYIDGVTSNSVSVKRGELPPEVEKVLFSTTPGGVTPLIRRSRAVYVARVLRHVPGGKIPFGEVRDDLIAELWHAAREARELRQLLPIQEKTPLVVQEAALSAAHSTYTTVLGHVAQTSLTLADVVTQGFEVPRAPWDQKTQKALRGTLEKLAFKIHVTEWARQQRLDRSEDFRIRRQLARNTLLALVMLDRVGSSAAAATTPTREQLGTLLNENRDNPGFVKRAEYTVEQLELSPTEGMQSLPPAFRDELDQEMQRAMARVRAEAENGAALRELAARFVETSMTLKWTDLGTAPQGPRGRIVDMATRDLKPGRVSQVQKTPAGKYVVFGVNAVIPQRQMTVDQDASELEQMWRQERAAEARKALVQEAEKASAPAFDEQAIQAFIQKP